MKILQSAVDKVADDYGYDKVKVDKKFVKETFKYLQTIVHKKIVYNKVYLKILKIMKSFLFVIAVFIFLSCNNDANDKKKTSSLSQDTNHIIYIINYEGKEYILKDTIERKRLIDSLKLKDTVTGEES